MLIEDQLRKVVGKSSGKSYKFYDNKNLPRSQHSCFGDFPKDYLPKKSSNVIPLPDTQQLESSIAVAGATSKYFHSRLLPRSCHNRYRSTELSVDRSRTDCWL